jgi:hypothetical protein
LDKHPEEMMPKNPDPRDLGPKPPFPEQKQSHPGTVKRLNPPADHGENRYVRTGRLLGQAAIITGADSGIGRATAIAFAKEGADIVLSYLPEEEADALDVSVVIHETGERPYVTLEISGHWSMQKLSLRSRSRNSAASTSWSTMPVFK